MRRVVLGVTAALVASPALSQADPKPFALRCMFPGAPAIILNVAASFESGTAQVAKGQLVSLPPSASAGTRLPGRIYAFSHTGHRYVVNFPSSFHDKGAAHLTLWNTEQGRRAPGATYKEFRGRCRETR